MRLWKKVRGEREVPQGEGEEREKSRGVKNVGGGAVQPST